jgi:hypothetical protein
MCRSDRGFNTIIETFANSDEHVVLNDASKDLPAEKPTKVYLVINEMTAVTLGIKILDLIHVRADSNLE